MRNGCVTDQLADRLATAARATPAPASIPVAAGVRITAETGDQPAEPANDLELSLRGPSTWRLACPAEVMS